MKKRYLSGICFLLGMLYLFRGVCVPAATGALGAIEARQAIVVRTADWNASVAVLQAYQREGKGASWAAVGGTIPAVVGRKGLGWGAGLHPGGDGNSGPVKKEGDGKAPAGIFSLSSAFGYDPVEEMSALGIPYQQMTVTHQCVDDARSVYYNRIVDAGRIRPDWLSYEEMRRKDDLYQWGIVVDHNIHPVTAGKGSCIFLHIWQGPARGTSGCTAMAREDLQWLLRWLNPDARPVLVQLPEEEYARLREVWNLP